jgi:hypothetical protein
LSKNNHAVNGGVFDPKGNKKSPPQSGGVQAHLFLQETIMTSVDVRVHMKREITQEEIDKRVAHMKVWDEELRKANEESPLPDDFIEYVKGRKFRQAVPQ